MLPAVRTHCPGWLNAVDVALLLAAAMRLIQYLQLSSTTSCVCIVLRMNCQILVVGSFEV